MRDLHISAVLNGYVVRIDCQRLVFVSKLTLLSELGRYLDNPALVEQEYLAQFPAETGASGPPTPSSTTAELCLGPQRAAKREAR